MVIFTLFHEILEKVAEMVEKVVHFRVKNHDKTPPDLRSIFVEFSEPLKITENRQKSWISVFYVPKPWANQ